MDTCELSGVIHSSHVLVIPLRFPSRIFLVQQVDRPGPEQFQRFSSILEMTQACLVLFPIHWDSIALIFLSVLPQKGTEFGDRYEITRDKRLLASDYHLVRDRHVYVRITVEIKGTGS
jgi:hypothetical protein